MIFGAIVFVFLYGCVDTHYNNPPKEEVVPVEDDGAWLYNWVGLEEEKKK